MCALVPTVADQFGLSGVWLTIALMGAMQGPLFPTSSVYLSRWMPGKDAPGGDEKAWGTSMLDIGISLGSLLIIPVGNGLAEAYGWRNTYRILGGATMAFVGLWQILAAETPRGCWFIGAEELKYLEQHVPPPAGRRELRARLRRAPAAKLRAAAPLLRRREAEPAEGVAAAAVHVVAAGAALDEEAALRALARVAAAAPGAGLLRPVRQRGRD